MTPGEIPAATPPAGDQSIGADLTNPQNRAAIGRMEAALAESTAFQALAQEVGANHKAQSTALEVEFKSVDSSLKSASNVGKSVSDTANLASRHIGQ